MIHTFFLIDLKLLPKKVGKTSGLLKATNLYQNKITKAIDMSRSYVNNIKKKIKAEVTLDTGENILTKGLITIR